MNGTLVLHGESGGTDSGGASSILHGFRSGAADAREAAARFVPEAARILRQCAYQTGYGLAYGVVFPSVLIARTIPQDNPVVHGFVDGAAAARDLALESTTASLTPLSLATP